MVVKGIFGEEFKVRSISSRLIAEYDNTVIIKDNKGIRHLVHKENLSDLYPEFVRKIGVNTNGRTQSAYPFDLKGCQEAGQIPPNRLVIPRHF